jgi:pentatricopeptide repeat protein
MLSSIVLTRPCSRSRISLEVDFVGMKCEGPAADLLFELSFSSSMNGLVYLSLAALRCPIIVQHASCSQPRLFAARLCADSVAQKEVKSLLAKARKSGQIAEILTEHPPRNVWEYNRGISAYSRARDTESAMKLLRDMQTSGIEPDVYSWSAAIASCEKTGQWQQALSLLEEMQAAGVAPTTVTFNSLISACGKAGKWERALSLLKDEMREAKVAANTVTFNSAMSACARCGKWEQALKLLVTMPSAGCQPDTISFNSCISACARGGEWERAVSLIVAMKSAGVPPNVISFNTAISACARGKEFERALSLLNEMKSAGGEFSTLTFGLHLWPLGPPMAGLHSCQRRSPGDLH